MLRVVGELWQAVDMTSWILAAAESLNSEQRTLAEGLAAMIERVKPPHLDVAESSVVTGANRFHVTLMHDSCLELRIDVDAAGDDEVAVSYGLEHEHFSSRDAEDGRVWPFPSEDHIETTLTLVEFLLTGRIELWVWKRPLGIRTRSYWIDDEGHPELFLRGGTAGPYFGWSRSPKIYRFDYTQPCPSP
jgi:hypothetical protein